MVIGWQTSPVPSRYGSVSGLVNDVKGATVNYSSFHWSTCFSRCNVVPNRIHGIRVPGPLSRAITSPRPQKHRNQVLVTDNTADPGAKLVVAGDGQYLGGAREYGETA